MSFSFTLNLMMLIYQPLSFEFIAIWRDGQVPAKHFRE